VFKISFKEKINLEDLKEPETLASITIGIIIIVLFTLILTFGLQNPSKVDYKNQLLIFVVSIIPAYGLSLKARDKNGYFRPSAIVLLFIGLGYALIFIVVGFPLLFQPGLNWGPPFTQIGMELIFTILTVFGLTARVPGYTAQEK
jgi:hypothetical protein